MSLQFHDSWKDLLSWLTDIEKNLDDDTAIGNDPDKIKRQIAAHRDFQRTLGSKQPAYDAVNRSGRRLKEKAPKTDVPVIQDMLNELKNKWNSICAHSVDR